MIRFPDLVLYIRIAGQQEAQSSAMTIFTIRRWTNFGLPIKSSYAAVSNIMCL